eukprot:jgi/Hompol1/1004/HPOL_004807-RA
MIAKEVFQLEERLVISHNLAEEWVVCVFYERLLDRIFVACDTSIYVYDYETGDRIDSFYNIHELPITCITFYEPFEYLITGGKDGTIIGTGFPVHKDTLTKDLVYNMNQERLYSFNTNGDVIVFDSHANPFKILDIWEMSKLSSRDLIVCICGIDIYNHRTGDNLEVDHRLRKIRRAPSFILVGGTESGQILNIDVEQRGRTEILVQAHTARVTMLNFDPLALRLVSGGNGMAA